MRLAIDQWGRRWNFQSTNHNYAKRQQPIRVALKSLAANQSSDLNGSSQSEQDLHNQQSISSRLDMPIEFDILLGAEVACQRQTIEILANGALVEGRQVEEHDEEQQQQGHRHQTHSYQHLLTSTIIRPERNVRQECVGEQEANQKTEQVCIVVHPGE